MLKRTLRTVVAALALTTPAVAQDYTAAMTDYFSVHVAGWAENEAIIAALKAQNERHIGLTEADITAMDTAWRNEVGADDAPTITPVLQNPASDFLRQRVSASGGIITEVFVTDTHGLNVAASDVTSDYWQGDEEKHTATYGAGSGAMHVSDIEFDESSQTYQGQVSVTISDPATGEPIGAITVGLDAEGLL